MLVPKAERTVTMIWPFGAFAVGSTLRAFTGSPFCTLKTQLSPMWTVKGWAWTGVAVSTRIDKTDFSIARSLFVIPAKAGT
jgi:hypothetical protein